MSLEYFLSLRFDLALLSGCEFHIAINCLVELIHIYVEWLYFWYKGKLGISQSVISLEWNTALKDSAYEHKLFWWILDTTFGVLSSPKANKYFGNKPLTQNAVIITASNRINPTWERRLATRSALWICLGLDVQGYMIWCSTHNPGFISKASH